MQQAIAALRRLDRGRSACKQLEIKVAGVCSQYQATEVAIG